MSLPPAGSADQPDPPRNPVLLGLMVGVLVFAIAVIGFAGWRTVSGRNDALPAGSTGGVGVDVRPVPTTDQTAPPTAASLAAYYDQKLTWRSCHGRDLCLRLRVPLDYAKPAGTSISIAVLKVPAGDPAHRVGALVVNPGGPGAPGTDFAAAGAAQFGDTLARYYDIVGFDPRGVGQSNPLRCGPTAQIDGILAADPDPDTAAGWAALDSLSRNLGKSCLTKSGDLARHISTKEAARDMDILRAALRQPKLDYLGSSYGTFLGATYAEEFPTHVGRFVLDGAIDPALSTEQLSIEQAKGFETALRAYLRDCVSNGCFLGSTVGQAESRIQALLKQLDAHPLPTGSPRQLTEGLGMIGIWTPLYAKNFWPQLTAALKGAIEDHSGADLLALADEYASRGPKGYTDNSIVALNAINCLDHDDYIPTAEVPAHFSEFEKASPTFGRAFAFGLSSCSDWPVRSGQRTVALHAKGAPAIVVVGTTRDPATPYAWAKALANELDSSRLITRDGDGHTGFMRGNSCVDQAVERWLVSGDLPRRNLKC
jgi:pimeloyl-ACP methyl ester carboxylesterase